MKASMRHLLSGLLCMIFACPVYAELGKRPRVGLAYTDYDLEGIISSSESISATSYMSIDLGLTLIQDAIFFDVAYSTSYDAVHDFTDTGADADFDRYDFALAAGYLLADHWSVFGGYKYGESEYSNYALAAAPNTALRFETEGFFGGVSKTIPMDNNALSFNASLALLDGTMRDNDIGATPFNASADTLGLSLGAAYSIPLEQGFSFVARFSYQRYDFSDFSDPVYNIDDVTESILNIGASIYTTF